MEKSEANKKFDKAFGAYLKAKREAKGWSQAELASKVGNNYQNISRMERGEITPTLFWCTKLAAAFDMKLAAFIKVFNPNL